jgi:hypothetical protein
MFASTTHRRLTQVLGLMGRFTAVASTALAGLVVQPTWLLIWLLDQAWWLCAMSLIFAAPFVLFLGLPLMWILKKARYFRWWPLALIGALAGSVMAGWRGPGADPGTSYGGSWYGQYRQFVVDGEPTFYGWLNYAQSLTTFAVHGLLGATAMYWAWRRMSPNNSSKPTPLRGAA